MCFFHRLFYNRYINSEQNKFLKYKNAIYLKNEMIKSAKIKQDNLIICELREERKQ